MIDHGGVYEEEIQLTFRIYQAVSWRLALVTETARHYGASAHREGHSTSCAD